MKQKRRSENVFTKLSYVFIVLMLTVFLFWFDSSGYSGITEAKLTMFNIICGGYVILTLILIPASLATEVITKQELKAYIKESTWVQRLLLAFLLLTVVSALLSPYKSETWVGATRYEGVRSIALYVLSAVFLSSFGRVKSWMAYLLGGSVLCFSVISIIQLYGGNPFGLYPGDLNYFGAGVDYSGEYLGTIGNTDLVAAFLCVAITLLWVAVVRMKGKWRYLLLIPTAAALFVLLKMSVMAGLVGVFGGAVLALPVVLPVSAKTRKIIAIAILALFVLALVFLYIADIGGGMLHEAHELLHGNVSDTFGSGRIHIWKNVLEKIPDNLWFGTGPDTMSHAQLEAFTRYDPDKGVQLVAEIDTAHNEYLNILFHQGIFALLAYLAALVLAAAKWIKQGSAVPAAAACGAAVLCYCIQAFFGISMFLTAPFFWMTLGLLDGSLRTKAK